jgi:MFS transporter, DHA2 family, multidrug resistance protein
MVGPIAVPLFGGMITDLASWRWAFALSLPLGILSLCGMWRILPRAGPIDRQPIDATGIFLLVVGIGAMQLALQRGVGQSWLYSPELIVEATIALFAATGMLLRPRDSGSAVVRTEVLRDLGFAAAAFFNFMTSALLFTSLVFIPALTEGPLGYGATLAGATIVPRAVLMMLMMLMVGRLIGRIDFRILLAAGWGLMAAGLLILSDIRPPDELLWLIVGSTIQAIGAGMMFTPLSTFAFATLPAGMRTDAAGLYSLLRQLGCASGVALMSAVLQMKISTHLAGLSATAGAVGAPPPARLVAGAALQAYAECFRVMAIATVVVTPGILWFRAVQPATAETQAAPPSAD